jgi:hypothetical protein
LRDGPAAVELLVHPEGAADAIVAGQVQALTRALHGAIRVTLLVASDAHVTPRWTFAPGGPAAAELSHLRDLHPELAERLGA